MIQMIMHKEATFLTDLILCEKIRKFTPNWNLIVLKCLCDYLCLVLVWQECLLVVGAVYLTHADTHTVWYPCTTLTRCSRWEVERCECVCLSGSLPCSVAIGWMFLGVKALDWFAATANRGEQIHWDWRAARNSGKAQRALCWKRERGRCVLLILWEDSFFLSIFTIWLFIPNFSWLQSKSSWIIYMQQHLSLPQHGNTIVREASGGKKWL